MNTAYTKAQKSACNLDFPIDLLTNEPNNKSYYFENPDKLEHIYEDGILITRSDDTNEITTIHVGHRSEGGGSYIYIVPIGYHYMIYCNAFAH